MVDARVCSLGKNHSGGVGWCISVNSRLCVLGETTYYLGGGGVNLMHFLNFACVLGVFGGNFGFGGGGEFPSQKIAGINTGGVLTSRLRVIISAIYSRVRVRVLFWVLVWAWVQVRTRIRLRIRVQFQVWAHVQVCVYSVPSSGSGL